MGEDRFITIHIERVLQQRLPGIQFADTTITPVPDGDGKAVKDS